VTRGSCPGLCMCMCAWWVWFVRGKRGQTGVETTGSVEVAGGIFGDIRLFSSGLFVFLFFLFFCFNKTDGGSGFDKCVSVSNKIHASVSLCIKEKSPHNPHTHMQNHSNKQQNTQREQELASVAGLLPFRVPSVGLGGRKQQQ